MLAGAVAVSAAAVALAPVVLRRVPRFAVQRVEITGAHLIRPYEVFVASGIKPRQSVWDNPAPWETQLRRHPVIRDARVTRRFPGTLIVHVEEVQPAGFVEDGALRPITEDGAFLPVDPARVSLDLPVLRTRGLGDRAAEALIAEAARLGRTDRVFWAHVSEIAAGANGALAVRTMAPHAEVLIPAGADARRLRQLRSALDRLQRDSIPDAVAPTRVDMRWAEQVVLVPSRS